VNFKNTYRPLPKSLTIKKSGIDGLGLFAIDDIKVSTELGITHIYLWDNWIRTPLGGFINHSTYPNCYIKEIIKQDKKCRVLYTLRDINKKEELTVYYKIKEYINH
jgi:SET domain-containing protein